MSHDVGAVKFNDGTIKYYEYNGTSDVVISHIYDSLKEVRENWRNHVWEECNCENEEEVRIYSNYGGGFTFDGLACRECKSLRSKREDVNDYGGLGWFLNEKSGIPKWVIDNSEIEIADYRLK